LSCIHLLNSAANSANSIIIIMVTNHFVICACIVFIIFWSFFVYSFVSILHNMSICFFVYSY
jgi:hypothetical protein